MSIPFVGRSRELTKLRFYLKQNMASLLVITGRRRVGKSRLIEEFASGHSFVRFSGLAPEPGVTDKTQREEFARRLALQYRLPPLKTDDWSDLLETLADNTAQGRHIILLDELSWMALGDPSFLAKLKTVWDEKFKRNPQLILILCSSISSWIRKNILSSTGYVGRVNYVMHLDELPLRECVEFWGNKTVSAFEQFKILSVTGGIPLYLENIDYSSPAETNIQRLCFTKGGLLVREFNAIFSDYFSSRSHVYEKILRVLVRQPSEASDICRALDLPYTGMFSEYLNDLQQAGFISRDYAWNIHSGKDKRISRYRLSDNYTRFYLKYIDPVLSRIERNSFDYLSLPTLDQWEVIAGLQFENLVLNNRYLIKKILMIKAGNVVNDNPYYQRATKKIVGCQIDYMIQTRFNTLYLCEIKFRKSPIGSDIISELQDKQRRLVIPKQFTIRPVLIHVNGVTDDVVDARYFDEIIDFSQFFSDQH